MIPLLRLCVVFGVCALVLGSVIRNDEGNFELLILHNNDMHARFEQTSQLSGVCNTADREAGKCYGGFPRVAHVVKEARAAAKNGSGPPVLYLNAGDTYTGTAWFTIYKWQIAAECLNALQPDAVSLGNHEFDEGVSGLSPFIRNLTSPVLAANLNLDKEPELKIEKNLRKSVVFDVNGIKVGVIGYLTPDTKFLADRNRVEYIDEIISLQKEVKVLTNENVHILIALGHSGYIKDMDIAREVEGIDLVIGGHSNTFLWNGTSPDQEKINGPYPTMIEQKSGKLVPVVQAYAYTKYLGKLLLSFDSKGEIITYSGNPILLDKSIPQDLEVLKVINHYSAELNIITETVLGTSSVVLDGLSCRLKECNIGNLITDSVIEYYSKHYDGEYWSDVAIAILQGGRIRTSIEHASRPITLTRGDWITVLPFSGYLVIVSMNGTTLLEALEHAVESWRPLDAPGQFLQLSGINVEYDFAKPPHSRIIKAEARCTKCRVPAFEEIKPENVYRVMMPNFLSEGGDGFVMFDNLPFERLEYDELTCVTQYLNDHNPVSAEVTGRIKIFNEKALRHSNAATTFKLSILVFAITTFIIL